MLIFLLIIFVWNYYPFNANVILLNIEIQMSNKTIIKLNIIRNWNLKKNKEMNGGPIIILLLIIFNIILFEKKKNV